MWFDVSILTLNPFYILSWHPYDMFILTFNRSMFYIDINRLKKTNRFILTFIIILCTLSTWICHAVPKPQIFIGVYYPKLKILEISYFPQRAERAGGWAYILFPKKKWHVLRKCALIRWLKVLYVWFWQSFTDFLTYST